MGHDGNCGSFTSSRFRITKKVNDEIKVRFSLLQRIAEFYEFPSAVFCMQLKDFPKGTRKDSFKKKLDKLKKAMREFLGED